jgi:hypothetical protein
MPALGVISLRSVTTSAVKSVEKAQSVYVNT